MLGQRLVSGPEAGLAVAIQAYALRQRASADCQCPLRAVALPLGSHLPEIISRYFALLVFTASAAKAGELDLPFAVWAGADHEELRQPTRQHHEHCPSRDLGGGQVWPAMLREEH